MRKQSIMWTYIAQEKEKMLRLFEEKQIQKVAEKYQNIKAIYITAHGSSYNAAVSVSDFIAQQGHLRCYCYTPCHLLYQQHSLWNENPDTTLVIAISQTGTSTGVLQAVEEVKKRGFHTLGITAVMDSKITQISEDILNLHCGEELSNAKTKGYSCTLLTLLLLGVALGKQYNTIESQKIYNEIHISIMATDALINQVYAWCEENQMGKDMQDFYVIGYGYHFGTALEGQLKVMETMCIPTMFNDLMEFSHGMHRSINRDSTILLIKAGESLEEMMETTYQYLKTICAHVYMIDTMKQDDDSHRLYLPHYEATHSLLNITTALQIISVYAPEYNGLDPNAAINEEYTEIVSTRSA